MAYLGSLIKNTPQGRRLSAKGRAMSMVALLVLLGLGMGVLNVPLASSAANAVEVLHTGEAAPTDPQSPIWDRATEIVVPLSSQQMQQPGGGSTREVMVKAIEDGQRFAIRVSWADDTKNDTTGNVPSDAAAIQLPMDPAHLPYQCMGQSTSRVNIWQWKAALEKQGGEDLGASNMAAAGVRNLTSNGICKAVDAPGAQPMVQSFHDGTQWHVVFYRSLGPAAAGTAPLTTAASSSIAFAVWNGAHGEARGMKAVSTWNTLQFQTPQANSMGNLVAFGFVILLAAGAVGWAMRRMAGR